MRHDQPARAAILAVIALAVTFGAGSALAAPAAIDRIDPPSWWVGFESQELQLMVHGPRVAELGATVDYPGVRLASVTRLESPNFLYLNLRLDRDAHAGRVPLVFRRDGKVVARRDYALEARRPGSRERKGFDASDTIYLIVPDRFANGDPRNDRPPGSIDRVDRKDPGARHGGDIAGVAAHLDYIERMGFTQIWLTPVLENAQPSFSYHGYAITDHYRVDPRFGTREGLRELSRNARAHGIGLIGDVVVNHIGSQHWWMQDLPSPDWISGGGRQQLTNHKHSTIVAPYAAEVDRRLFIDGWFSREMPDLHPMSAELGTYLVQQSLWWIEYADLSGLRMDTYSYSDKRFMAAFTQRIMSEYPHLNIVGEEWRSEPPLVAYWQAGKTNADGYVSYLPSLMDFPLQFTLTESLKKPEQPFAGLVELYERLAQDFLYANPRNLVVFADNHDTDRIYTALGRDDALLRMAIAFVATTRGIPQLLYGTEVMLANEHPGNDGEKRADFPGGWPGDPVDGFSGRGLEPRTAATQEFVRTLLNWRKHSRAVQFGSLRHYAPVGGAYVYFRQLDHETVMVALNKAASPVKLDLGRFRESLLRGAVGRDVLSGARIELGDELVLAPRSTTVLDIN